MSWYTGTFNYAEHPTLIELEELNLFYGNHRAVKEIKLAVPARAVTAIIGPSGCGKSTLLRTLNRINDRVAGFRAQGTIKIDGANIYDPATDVTELRRRVGMVFQRPNPFPQTIFENVAFSLTLGERPAQREIAEQVEQALRHAALWDEVKDKLRQPATALSGGQQQRLCIARAIASRPEVLLMDEPCSALDPIATLRIEELMGELKRDYTIVIVTHNMQQAARASDLTVMMMLDTEDRAGYIVEVGETPRIFRAPTRPETEAYISGRLG